MHLPSSYLGNNSEKLANWIRDFSLNIVESIVLKR